MATTTARQAAHRALHGGYIHLKHFRKVHDRCSALSRDEVLAELGVPFAPELFDRTAPVRELRIETAGAQRRRLHRRTNCTSLHTEAATVDLDTYVNLCAGRAVTVQGVRAHPCRVCIPISIVAIARDDIPHAWAATEIAVVERLLERARLAVRAKTAPSRQQGRDAHRHARQILDAFDEITELPGDLEEHRRRQQRTWDELRDQIDVAAAAAADSDRAKLESRLRGELGVSADDLLDDSTVIVGIPQHGIKGSTLVRSVYSVFGVPGSDSSDDAVLVCPAWVWGWLAGRQQRPLNTAAAGAVAATDEDLADPERFAQLCQTAAGLYQPRSDTGLRTIAAAVTAARLVQH